MEDVDKQAKKPVELTKKQELNNHIVLMRKVVRTARVHIINKLTKDVKKLKERKGDEKALEKSKRKAERILQEIQTIKHLREDKVSIYALQDKTKLEEVLQDPKATTENRALSRFSHHKLIQGEVLKYRSQNIYWDLQIPVLLERSKDKRRRINKKLAEKEAELLTGRNKTRKVEANGEEGGEDSSSDLSDLEENGEEDANSSGDEDILDTSLDTDNVVGVTDDLDSILTKTKQKIKTPALIKPTVSNKKLIPQQKKQLSTISKPLHIQYTEISKTEGTVRVQHLKDLTDLDNTESIKSEVFNRVTVKDLSNSCPKPRPKSSFFVGGVDEIVEEPPQERKAFDNKKRGKSDFQKNTRQSHNESSEFKPLFRKGKLVNKAPKSFNKGSRPSQRGGNQNNGRFQTQGGANSNLTPLGDRSREGKGDTIPKKQPASSTTTQSEKLHPSWEAKKRQQQQPALAAFKGKKTKFDDD